MEMNMPLDRNMNGLLTLTLNLDMKIFNYCHSMWKPTLSILITKLLLGNDGESFLGVLIAFLFEYPDCSFISFNWFVTLVGPDTWVPIHDQLFDYLFFLYHNPCIIDDFYPLLNVSHSLGLRCYLFYQVRSTQREKRVTFLSRKRSL